jgi:hypothetical protein
MSVKQLLASRATGHSLLTGSDVPDGTKSITIQISDAREAPDGFGAPLIIDFKKPQFTKASWAVNKTNVKALAKLLGDDEKSWLGKQVKLEIISVRNPQTGEIVPSLAVSPRQ